MSNNIMQLSDAHSIRSVSDNGFTLIELMIVVAVIGVLAAVAYPSYQSYVIKSKRADMMAEMQQIASRIESNKINYKRYDNIPLTVIFSNTVTSGATTFPNSGTALYNVQIWDIQPSPPVQVTTANLPGQQWQIRAIPVTTAQMASDGTLTLNHQGRKCRGTSCGMGEEWKD